MEWIIFIFAAVTYFMIGGFINGLIDMDMGPGIVIWPLIFALWMLWSLIELAEVVGYIIRDVFEH